MFKKRKITIRRFAYYLLIVSIVLSCVTNGIFAKFTTEDDGGDGARVAKFGIILSVAGDLFSTTYNEYADDGTGSETASSNIPAVFTEVDTDDGISVQAHYKYVLADGTGSDDFATGARLDNVLAPGTKNDQGVNISIQGTAETDCVIEYEITSSTIALKTTLYDYTEGLYPDTAGFETYTRYFYDYDQPIEVYSYCIMVQMQDGIIREDNFREFKDTLYTLEDVDGNKTYTKVSDDFDSEATYYQSVDVAKYKEDYYMPIIFKPYGYSKLAEMDNITDFLIKYLGLEYNERYNNGETNSIQHLNDYSLGQLITNELNNNVVASESVFPYKCTSKGTSGVIETGTNLDIDLDFTWEWPFVESESETEESKNVDSCDTILGHLMAGNEVFKSNDGGETYTKAVEGEDYNLEVEFDINITINQVD